MYTLLYSYFLAIYAAVGVSGDPVLDGDFVVHDTRSATQQVSTDKTVPPRRSHADGLDPDIYNGF